jgi:hypothetical protein
MHYIKYIFLLRLSLDSSAGTVIVSPVYRFTSKMEEKVLLGFRTSRTEMSWQAIKFD